MWCRRALLIAVCVSVLVYLADSATTTVTTSTGKPAKAGGTTTKPGATAAKPGATTAKAKPGAAVPAVATRLGTNVKSNATKPGNIITLRIGEDGNPSEQCQCVTFHLCDRDNQVLTSPTGESVQCDTLQVCCSIITAITDDPPVPTEYSPPIVTPPSTTPYGGSGSQPVSPPANCRCVPFHQCQNYDPEVAKSGAGLIDPRISACQSSEICCPLDVVVTEPPPVVNPGGGDNGGTTEPEPECGYRKPQIDTRIVSPENLMQTSFGEFPWMALVLTSETAPNGTRIENVFVCGGSIISNHAVLTAAHCITDTNINQLKIRVGEYDTHRSAQNEPFPHVDRNVDQVHIHPGFNPRTLFNDTAILIVSESFNYAPNVAPICLPTVGSEFAAAGYYDPSSCVATGWGKNAFDEGSFQTKLRKVDLSLVSNDDCQLQLRGTRLGQFFNLDKSFICAGGQKGMDTCQGDGGGPLVCAVRGVPNRYVQVGIVSWGIGCGNEIPAVYASLEANSNWLTAEYNSLFVFRRG